MTLQTSRLLPAWCLIAGLAAGWFKPASGGVCDFPVTVAVDIVQADTAVTPFICRGYGQVFLATDTLIESISIWRPPTPALDGAPRQLFITETFVDPEGVPDVDRLLLDAGPLVRQAGDGIHPVEYRWVFNPPFALPHQGNFFFDIQASRFSSWLVPAVTTNPYPYGHVWETSAVFDCSRPAGLYYGDGYSPPNVDLAFEVRFCGSGATGVPPPGARPLALLALPNPFQRELQVSFDLPSSTYVRLAVFDLTGRRVATLIDGELDPGPHRATWGAPSAIGGRAGPGLYFIRLEAAGQRLTRTAVHIE